MQLPASVALLHCVQQCYAVSRCCTRVGSNILVEDMWCVCAHVRACVRVCVRVCVSIQAHCLNQGAFPILPCRLMFGLLPFLLSRLFFTVCFLLFALCSLLLRAPRFEEPCETYEAEKKASLYGSYTLGGLNLDNSNYIIPEDGIYR